MDFIEKIKVPKNMDSYIRSHVAPAYVYLDKKSSQAYCTSCGKKYKPPATYTYKHNGKVCCPKCKRVAEVKYSHYGRKKLHFTGKIFWLQKDGQNTLAGLAMFEVDYTPSTPKISYYPDAAYSISAKKQEYYRYDSVYENGNCTMVWKRRKRMLIPQKAHMFGNGEEVYFYQPSISNLGTDFKYMDISLLGDNIDPILLLEYMLNFIKHKSTDLLVKAGFKELVHERIAGRSISYNIRGTNLESILRLGRREIRTLPKNIGNKALATLHLAKEVFPNAMPEILDIMTIYVSKDMMDILKQYDTNVLYKYLIKNQIYIRDYIDYLTDIKKLNLPETKRVLRPKDFESAHQRLANRRAAVELERRNDEFKKYEEEIALGSYEEDKYIILVPESPTELVTEGERQHHCVGTYVDRVCDGKCAITFLRDKSNPDKPLYTIELNKDRRIMQCRGEHNCGYDEEIKEVLGRYTKWLEEEHNERIKNAS